MSDLFRRHPQPWTIFSGVVFDGNGTVVDLTQAQVRAALVEAVNALEFPPDERSSTLTGRKKPAPRRRPRGAGTD